MDLKNLKDLLASVTDRESLNQLSSKPFQPSMLDWLISKDIPQFYSKKELLQLDDYYEQLSSCYESYAERNNAPRMVEKRYL